MKTRWTRAGEREALGRWGDDFGPDFARRLYTARLIGQDPELVLHGGGNVSWKGSCQTRLGDEQAVIHVKGSGCDLSLVEPADLPALDLAYLRRLRSLDALDDEAMVNECRTHLLDASAPTPSIETLLHAFVPYEYVDHSHADAVLTIANLSDGRSRIVEALGNRVAVVDYVRPGFDLAKAIAQAVENRPNVEGVVLLHHGLVTFAHDARTSYEQHISLVDACEQYIKKHDNGRPLTIAFLSDTSPADLATLVAPLLRGLLAEPTGNEDQPHRRPILEWRANRQLLQSVNSREMGQLVTTGPLSGDHLIRTKPHYLFIENPAWSNEDALRKQLSQAVELFRKEYQSYVAAHRETAFDVDSAPRVVLLPGAGAFCWGPTKQEARITADIVEHTLRAKIQANALGTYEPLSPVHWFDMEHRALQRSKLSETRDRPLDGQVVVISGGAGAIGASVAEVCVEAGAHVAIMDIDEKRISRAVDRAERIGGPGTAIGLAMDVTNEESVVAGYAKVVQTFGGVDVIVPNAGIAHVAAMEDLEIDDFRRVLEINAVGYLLFMREGIRILKRQGLSGHIIINASKNVFAPGKEFGAYSASKAAGHQLGKVAAIELAPHGIRVNMINADAVFGDDECPSGLWATVGPQRAKSRNLKPDALAEYYRERSLLKLPVRGRHVGHAVVFFASNATPTTGATLPVDGGIPEAFPR